MKSLLVLFRAAQLLPIDKEEEEEILFDDYEDHRPETCLVKQLGQDCDCESACMGG